MVLQSASQIEIQFEFQDIQNCELSKSMNYVEHHLLRFSGKSHPLVQYNITYDTNDTKVEQ